MTIQIYPVEGGYVFSSDGTWMPGVYETERACQLMSQHSPASIKSLWDTHGPEPISEALLDVVTT